MRPQLEAQCTTTRASEDDTTSETGTTYTRASRVELQPRRTARNRGDTQSLGYLKIRPTKKTLVPGPQGGQGENYTRLQAAKPCTTTGGTSRLQAPRPESPARRTITDASHINGSCSQKASWGSKSWRMTYLRACYLSGSSQFHALLRLSQRPVVEARGHLAEFRCTGPVIKWCAQRDVSQR